MTKDPVPQGYGARAEDLSLVKKYVIQLATFEKRKSAEQELSRLRADGYEADIRKSGSYYQIYVGGFVKKRDAQILLEGLRKKYKDCYIKFAPSPR